MLLVLLLLCGVSALPEELVKKAGFKPLRLLSDLKPENRYRHRGKINLRSDPSQKTGESGTVASLLQPEGDTLLFSFDPVKHALESFFMALEKKKKVRIAYFGDSMIEGDLITQTIRELYQKKYGGAGVGMMPLTSAVAGFRQSISHVFSDNWRENNILANSPKGREPGITGHVFFPPAGSDSLASGEAIASYRCAKGFGNSPFHRARVILSGRQSGAGVALKHGNEYTQKQAQKTGRLEALDFDVEGESGPLQFRFSAGDYPVYGISFEADSGVYVDNLGFRGNSGLPMSRIPASLLQQFDSLLSYDLVILHYGINAVSAEVEDYSWYSRGLMRTLLHFRKAMPGTPILLIGTADKGYNSEEGYITDPGVPRVVEAQKKAAHQSQTAFLDLFQLMGGEGTMVRWVESDRPLANKDYTHLNFSGASKIGKMIFDCLEEEKKRYIIKKENI
jgi:lysophospholipase L1-like esterase